MTVKNGYDQQTADELREGAREDAQRCPDGFRCGHCMANDKAKREAAREQVAQRLVFEGLHTNTAQLGSAVGYGYAQARRFTREEVLTVLKTLRAGGPDGAHADAVRNAYDAAIRTFERME